MKYTRPLLLAASTVALFVSACSTPADLNVPTLEPQFGAAADDSATTVAVNSAHPYVFAAGTFGTSETQAKVFIRRYNRDGSLAWERLSVPQGAGTAVGGAGTDAVGNAYVAYAGRAVTLSKLDKDGSLLWRKQLTEADTSYGSSRVSAFVTDNSGNSYVAIQHYLIQDEGGFEDASELRKYDPVGRLLWQQRYKSNAVLLDDLTVDSGGVLYSTSRQNGNQKTLLTRYGTGGQVTWQVQVNDGIKSSVAARDGSVYVADESSAAPTYSEYSTAGAFKRQVGTPRFTFSDILDISVDVSSHVYLTGLVSRADDASGDYDLVVQKHASSGALLWVYTPRLVGTDEVTSQVAARTTGELYVVGRTDGKVNGQNSGRLDAFLLRLNHQGSRVWSR